MNNTATELFLTCFDVDNDDDMMRPGVSDDLIFVFEARQENWQQMQQQPTNALRK